MFDNIEPYPNPKPPSIVRVECRIVHEDDTRKVTYGNWSQGFVRIPQNGRLPKIKTERHAEK